MEYCGRNLEENWMEEMKTKIIVATHKQFEMPDEDIYLPLQVGASCTDKDFGYCKDNTGDNISEKNPYFCELTGLYWAWKNLDCDYLGMAHYRRHFTVKSGRTIRKCGDNVHEKMKCVLNAKELSNLEQKYDIILPARRHYLIETLYSHYSHSHYEEHLKLTREIIKRKYSEYLPYFDKVMKARSGCMFNMFIMKKSLADQYCNWLFDILGELEQKVDVERLSPFQARLYGRVAEIIFNAWLLYQIEINHYKVREIGYLSLGPTDWGRKVTAFLGAKLFHKKYEGSF